MKRGRNEYHVQDIIPKEGITIEDIRGKVVYVIPKLGYPKYLLSRLFSG